MLLFLVVYPFLLSVYYHGSCEGSYEEEDQEAKTHHCLSAIRAILSFSARADTVSCLLVTAASVRVSECADVHLYLEFAAVTGI